TRSRSKAHSRWLLIPYRPPRAENQLQRLLVLMLFSDRDVRTRRRFLPTWRVPFLFPKASKEKEGQARPLSHPGRVGSKRCVASCERDNRTCNFGPIMVQLFVRCVPNCGSGESSVPHSFNQLLPGIGLSRR